MKADEIKDDLKDLTRCSSFLHREIGLCVCETGEEFLRFGEEIYGQIHCGACNPKILFHTHLFDIPIPTVGDIDGIKKLEVDLNNVEYCIGAMDGKKPKVKCFKVSKKGNYIKLGLGFDL